MAMVVFLRGANVGGHRKFLPSVLAKEMGKARTQANAAHGKNTKLTRLNFSGTSMLFAPTGTGRATSF